ncbi:MAG: type I-E CRISPR-associated protein Cse1/CasA [Anaerolineaceae bacterium]|nr:type I-E CRISPR-associated protein Cse1/CasA [Anaerolineaceae bacterium]
MKVTYNLVDESWIPCMTQDGIFSKRSLRDVLLSAHEIREIHAELPPMTASLLMLLLAVLYRSLHPQTEEDWQVCLNQGFFDPQKINAYLDEWHHRFDLFDTEHPFYQDPLIGKRPKDIQNLKGNQVEPKSVNGLLLHSSNGDGATLFDHSTDEQNVSFTLDQMTRLLLMIQGFSLGGMALASISSDKFYKDSPHSRGVVFFLRGQTLFETLLLNLIAKDELPEKFTRTNKDKPAWEMEDALANERDIPQGITDFLTWQSRRICLLPAELENRLTIKELYSAPGLSISDSFENPFYNITYDISKSKREKHLLRFSESKALWRDSRAILESHDESKHPPAALHWINILKTFRNLDYQINMLAYGLCSEPGQKKAYFYREESFSYPLDYLHSQTLRDALTQYLTICQNVKSQLWGALSQMAGLILAPAMDQSEGRKADPKDIQNLINHWDTEATFWKMLENPFYHLVNTLPQNQVEALHTWQQTIRNAALAAFDQAITLSGNNVKALKAGSKARRQLLAGIKKVLIPDEKEDE